MNTAALQRTRDLIARQPDGYDQSLWAYNCGTPACVAGYAVVANGGSILMSPPNSNLMPIHCQVPKYGPTRMAIGIAAARLLDLTVQQADVMFQGFPHVAGADTEDALAMLDHAIEHDQVRWVTLETPPV